MNYSIYIPEHDITIYVCPEYAITNKPGIYVKYYHRINSDPDIPEYHEKKIPVQIKNRTIQAHPNAHIEHPMQTEEEKSAASPAPKDIS